MKRILLSSILSAMALVFMTGTAFAVSAFHIPTELIKHDAEKTQPGYVLMYGGYDEDGDNQIVVLNMDGEVVHSIKIPTEIGVSQYTAARLVPDDNGNHTGNMVLFQGSGAGQIAGEMTWNGKLVRTVKADKGFALHHEIAKIWNKALGDYTYLWAGRETLSYNDALKLGMNPNTTTDLKSGANWSLDTICETNKQGEVIWRWSFADHIVQNYNPGLTAGFTGGVEGHYVPITAPTYGEPADYPGKININQRNAKVNAVGPYNNWNHINSLDYDPQTGHVVLNAKYMNEIYVIDHDNTFISANDWDANWKAAASDDGDFLYRFGNPAMYDQGKSCGYYDAGDYQYWIPHNIQWIGGLQYAGWKNVEQIPGYGDFIIFDNGGYNPIERMSRIIQWNPYIASRDSTGAPIYSSTYVRQPEAGYNSAGITKVGNSANYNLSNQINWYYAQNNVQTGSSFYSNYISSMQRMPNGNTYITAGASGHLFEVTSEGEVVWEYINPCFTSGVKTELTDSANMRDGNVRYRTYKIPADHPALQGKSLIPRGSLTNLDSYTGFGFGGGIGGSGGGGGGGGGAGGGY